MRALVTGASGFVGRHLVRLLVEQSDLEVIGLVQRAVQTDLGVPMLVCNLMDADLTARVIARYRPDVIYHLAAQTFVPQAVANPSATLFNNAGSQLNLLEACRKASLNPVVVVVSSAEVYGAARPEELPVTEDQPFRPANPYAVSKVTQDMLALQYYLSYGMRIVRVRPFNHVGPGQSDRFAVSNFARQIAQVEAGLSEPVMLVGNLTAQRDFLDVRDVVRAYLLLANEQPAGEVYNVASGQARSIQSILDSLLALSTATVQVHQDPSRLRPIDAPVMVGDSSALKHRTGWTPLISLECSLHETLEYWRESLKKSAFGE